MKGVTHSKAVQVVISKASCPAVATMDGSINEKAGLCCVIGPAEMRFVDAVEVDANGYNERGVQMLETNAMYKEAAKLRSDSRD